MADLGYGNVEILAGDGTRGVPEQAPFDAILVAASGPLVPEALKEQLAIGGRLVIPVGDERGQILRKIIRRSASSYEELDLQAVMFVPLIGEQGWIEDGRRSASKHRPGDSRKQSLPEIVAAVAEDLPDSTIPTSAAYSTASAIGAWSCLAKQATVLSNSIARAPRSRVT